MNDEEGREHNRKLIEDFQNQRMIKHAESVWQKVLDYLEVAERELGLDGDRETLVLRFLFPQWPEGAEGTEARRQILLDLRRLNLDLKSAAGGSVRKLNLQTAKLDPPNIAGTVEYMEAAFEQRKAEALELFRSVSPVQRAILEEQYFNPDAEVNLSRDGKSSAARESSGITRDLKQVVALPAESNVFKFRAECQPDVYALLPLVGKELVAFFMKPSDDGGFPDVDCVIAVRSLDLESLRNLIRRVVNGHVMLETIQPSHLYTGERDRTIPR